MSRRRPRLVGAADIERRRRAWFRAGWYITRTLPSGSVLTVGPFFTVRGARKVARRMGFVALVIRP